MENTGNRILVVLDSGPHKKGALYSLGPNPADVDDHLEALLYGGMIGRRGKASARVYVITAKGRKHLKAAPSAEANSGTPIAARTAKGQIILCYLGAAVAPILIPDRFTAALDELLRSEIPF